MSDYEIIEEDPTCELRITGISRENADKVLTALKEAEIVFNTVFIEVERVYECIYDCIHGRLVAA